MNCNQYKAQFCTKPKALVPGQKMLRQINKSMKQKIVKEGYDKTAEKYSVQRDEFKNIPYLKILGKLLSKSSTILDIGCGAGVPIDKYFAFCFILY